jgi:hypothetical protein
MEILMQLYSYLTEIKATWRDVKMQYMSLKSLSRTKNITTNAHTDITRGTCLQLCIKMNKCYAQVLRYSVCQNLLLSS